MSESALRSLEILALLANSSGLTVGEAAKELVLSRATTARLFASLEEGGWINSLESDRKFVPSLRIVSSAANVLRHNRIRTLMLPWLLELAERTNESCGLCFLERGQMTVTDSTEIVAEKLVTRFDGQTYSVVGSAGGKALLAYQPEAVIHQIADSGHRRLTERTKTTASEILEDVELTRTRGFAVTDREGSPDASGLAVPVRDRAGLAVASLGIGISGPLTDDFVARAAPIALSIGSRASLTLGHDSLRAVLG